jgi:hypothetical protein
MLPRLATLVKRNLPFGIFAPLAIGRNWPMTAYDLTIRATNLLLVRCSIFTSTTDDQLI